MATVIALDVSKGKSFYVIYQEMTCLYEGEITHTKSGFQALLALIERLPEMPEIVFESTGIYSRPVETFCQTNQLMYYVLNPLQAKQQMEKESLRKWKTDKRDAHRLAQTHWNNSRTKTTPAEPLYQELRDLSRFYQEIMDEIGRMRMHLHNAIQLTFPELERVLSNRLTSYGLTMIAQYPHPSFVLKQSRTIIKNQLMNATAKKISDNRARNKAEELIAYAKDSYPAVSERAIPVAKTRYYAEQLQVLLNQKEILAKQMIESAKRLEEFSMIASFPGIGELSAAQFIGELGDLRRFSDSRKANAYIGIDIRRYQSGKYLAQDHINKRGNPKGRKILFFIIKNMIRAQHSAPNHVVDYYYKLKKQPLPKKEKVAIVACMNKLLKCLHAMVRNGTRYDYSYKVSMDH
jgi:transposase